MGQGASSTRCPNPGESPSSQPHHPSLRRSRDRSMFSAASQNDSPDPRPLDTGNNNTNNNHNNNNTNNNNTNNNMANQSRRRSFSPDPDSVDSRRSARIRRRISRFVSPNSSLNYIPGRDPTPPFDSTLAPVESTTTTTTTEHNVASEPNNPRLPRIRTRLLPRRRSSANHSIDGPRRERPFSMLAPRLGPLPFSLPRSTGSLDFSHSHRTGDLGYTDLDAQVNTAFPTLRPRNPRLSESQSSTEYLSDRISQRSNLISERGLSGHDFGLGHTNSSSAAPRPHPHADVGSTSTTSSNFLDNTTNSDAIPTTPGRTRHSSHRALREARESLAAGSSRLSRSGEDQATVLSRLLSVAAAATAASLVGSNTQALSDARDASGDSVDGSFESFLRALQNGRLASALRNGGAANGSSESDIADDLTSNGSVGPLNFFRMFRFGATSTPAGQSNGNTENARMVPVIIVGIRSVNPREGNMRDGRPSPPFLEALSGSPTLGDLESIPASVSLPGSLSSSPRRSLSRAERGDLEANLSSTSTSDSGRSISNTERLGSEEYPSLGTSAREGLFGSSFSGSPRSSSDITDRIPTGFPNDTPQSSRPLDDENSPRLRSPSPDSSRGPSEGTRSWIIYVLGGSYPENHPILTTPSLFTDAPTYEDMMLLSSLIAPVKPPVASQEDVESAGGLFTVTLGDTLSQEIPGGVIQMNVGERCLVCLCDFENGEVCRQLVGCQHVFHRDCIDEWLTTGRNSCPLCRGKGVEETPRPPGEGSSANDTIASSA